MEISESRETKSDHSRGSLGGLHHADFRLDGDGLLIPDYYFQREQYEAQKELEDEQDI